MHTTNYFNTFILVAEDCTVKQAIVPEMRKGVKTIPLLQFELIIGNPYGFTSDDIIFRVHAIRKGMDPLDPVTRDDFFSKGQPCLRCSSLGKRYGWGIHCNGEGKVALVPLNTDEYNAKAKDGDIIQVRAMRNSRKN